MRSQSFRFIFVTILIALSHGDPIDQDEDVNPMTMKGFNNSLGTFVEYSGRATIAVEDLNIYASFNLESLLSHFKFFKKGRKIVSDYCLRNVTGCPNYSDEALLIGLIDDADDLKDVKIKRLPIGIGKYLNNRPALIDSTGNVHISFFPPLFRLGDEKDYTIDYINSISNRISLLESQLKSSQDSILEALTSARQKRLSPLVLTINQLKEEIPKIKAKLPPNRRLPFDETSVSDIYLLASVVPKQLDNQVVFQITVPLIEVEEFNVYRLTPIPRVVNGKIQLMDSETLYLGINDHQDRYFPIRDLKDCTELGNERFVCKHNQITHGDGDNRFACSLAAIRGQSSEACTFHQLEQSAQWTQLVAPNSWMVALTKELSLTGVCSGKRQELKINGSGILSIRGDCIVRSSVVTLQGEPNPNDPSKKGFASLQLSPKSSRETENTDQLLDIEKILRSEQEKQLHDVVQILRTEQEEHYHPMFIITGCLITAAVLILLAWIYLNQRKLELAVAQNPVNTFDAYPDPKNETRVSNLPLLEKHEV
ncbi:uncharacterized protein LOC108101283 [Drosophila ficusphila]|uniref:uncharacterized protein LOC108101283 n=1 Tax=Drosophila ficusphila TaxID=30025 RepID=UPI0007E7DFD2|nr:uncharacterized protein LOC108101283 [Drosophila ficusphila]